MKYGDGYFCVDPDTGVRLPERVYPPTVGFDYKDGTGDRGEFLTSDWVFDYRDPKTGIWYRIRIRGDSKPVLHKTAFDFDWASIPKLLRAVTCDKADYRVRAGSLPHDAGFCVHEIAAGLDMAFWNRLLYEVIEVYCGPYTGNAVQRGFAEARDQALRRAIYYGVEVGGPFRWSKTPEEIKLYRTLVSVQYIDALGNAL